MYINGINFKEVSSTRFVGTHPEGNGTVVILGDAEGWSVWTEDQGWTRYATLGAACIAAGELMANLPAKPVLKPLAPKSWAEVNRANYAEINEYRNQRLVGRISGEAWGRGEGY
jgi:hypothetical protein